MGDMQSCVALPSKQNLTFFIVLLDKKKQEKQSTNKRRRTPLAQLHEYANRPHVVSARHDERHDERVSEHVMYSSYSCYFVCVLTGNQHEFIKLKPQNEFAF
jgi:hypothetical protein